MCRRVEQMITSDHYNYSVNIIHYMCDIFQLFHHIHRICTQRKHNYICVYSLILMISIRIRNRF